MASELKILHLTLKSKWFDMIAFGEKKEEYREIKDYWWKRLIEREYTSEFGAKLIDFKKFDIVRFKNGYSKHAPAMDVKCKDILIDYGKYKWGAETGRQYFVIKLGKIL